MFSLNTTIDILTLIYSLVGRHEGRAKFPGWCSVGSLRGSIGIGVDGRRWHDLRNFSLFFFLIAEDHCIGRGVIVDMV
jgi:hypothetical protein